MKIIRLWALAGCLGLFTSCASQKEEKKMREAQLAGAKAMNTIWVRYRSGWAKQNADRIRKYNREYAKKRRGKNEVVDYLSLSVVERKIMEDVDNVK